MKKIPFNKPSYTGNEDKYVLEAMRGNKLSGDGYYSKKCEDWFLKELNTKKVLLTPSCTHALELAAILLDVKDGDEIIMPSYTFVSTANAFVLRGAKIIFVDIEPKTMCINADLIEKAITKKTKAIVPVHYAGYSCDMNKIVNIANKHNICIIEDAAQALMSRYENKYVGTMGHLAAFSFHETKNITSGGEGGMIIINDSKYIDRAEIIREKGTNRSQFFRGAIDKYSWMDIGSSYLPSELQSAYLWGQIEQINNIQNKRKTIWKYYKDKLEELQINNHIEIQTNKLDHNAHMFFIKTKDLKERDKLIEWLKENGIQAAFHYIPLHSSKMGKIHGKFSGNDRYTTAESEKLIRLPMWLDLTEEVVSKVTNVIGTYYKEKRKY